MSETETAADHATPLAGDGKPVETRRRQPKGKGRRGRGPTSPVAIIARVDAELRAIPLDERQKLLALAERSRENLKSALWLQRMMEKLTEDEVARLKRIVLSE